MEVVATIVGKVWECLYDATWRQFGSLYHYEDSTRKLTKDGEKLTAMRERVQGKIDEATTKGEIIFSDVMEWVQRVDDITEEAGSLREEEENERANKRCLKGLCIDPLSRYRFGKETRRKIEAISSLLQEGGFESVSRKAPPPGIIASSALSVNFKSREPITKEIVKALKDNSVSIVGICGMGGVGKTTLVNEISKQVVKNDLFDTVVMVVVTQTQNYVKIQGDIAKMLHITLPDDDNESARACFLWHNIKEKRKLKKQKDEEDGEMKDQLVLEQILIILDDVWEQIELDRIGIPFGENRRGCKVVLTSRSQDVCMEMDAKTFTVGTLPEKESWGLFRGVAGEIVDNPDINPIAREVADECDGLPIALVTVAGALKNRKSKFVWIDAARQLKRSAPTNIKGMDRKVFASLELSYNFLANEEEKSVFLLCCLFPEDFNIPIELLMRYGMGLRLFQEVNSVEEARGRTHTVVSTLTSSFLLITGNDEKHVKMHDVVRDVAIKLSKDKHMFMAKAGLQLRVWPSADTLENYTGISLMYNYIHEVPDVLAYPKLQALLLQENNSLVVSDNFFQGMKDLRVLEMSCIQKFPLPRSLQLLANLTTLCLNNSTFYMVDFSLIGKLTKLEILSLQGTNIMEIPLEFRQLVNIRLLDLRDCQNLRHIPQGLISCLKKLEELHVSSSCERLCIKLQTLCERIIFHIGTKEAGLTSLASSIILSEYMPFQNLTNFAIGIGIENFEPLKKYPSWSRILYSSISFQQVDEAYELLKNTEVLQLCQMKGLRNMVPHLVDHSFNELKVLELIDCMEITYLLLNVLEYTLHTAFDSLEYLSMEHIPNLVEICHGPLPAESFYKVKSISVSFCNNMLNIAPGHLLQRLQSLEIVEVCNCASVVYVFDFERLVIANMETNKFLSSLKDLRLVGLNQMVRIWNGDTKLITLCNLKRISLQKCSKLKQLLPPSLLQSLISLENMEISDCDSLEEIFGMKQEENHTATSPSLGNLSCIWISGCHKLKNLFTACIVKGMVKLRTLQVTDCSKIEEIVLDEKAETEAPRERITFPNLQEIYLGELDSLTCFAAGRCTMEFPALELVNIQDCPKMETFGRGNQVTPKLNTIGSGYIIL